MASENGKTRRVLNFRAFVTLLTTGAFAVMLLSGLVLYVAPRGRVANWTHWSIFGLDKEQWSDLHMTAAVVLLLAITFHLYFNFRPLCQYVRSRTARLGLRARELVAALALTVLLIVGTLWQVPPLSSVTAFNEAIKDGWEQEAGTVGRAPSTRVQEANIRQFAERMGLSPQRLEQVLLAHGITVDDPDTPIDALARRHGVSLQTIYEEARSGQSPEPHGRSGAGRGEGSGGGEGSGRGGGGAAEGRRGDGGGHGEGSHHYGRMTLEQFCEAEGVPLERAIAAMQRLGIDATARCRMRELATQQETTPSRLAAMLAAGD